MSNLRTTYDGVQHCTTVQEAAGKTVGAGAGPAHGGEGGEFSPLDLVGGGLASCMLLAMGTVALRDKLDINATRVDIEVSMTKEPVWRIGSINLTFNMPKNFSSEDRIKLERAADVCPIKHSFHPDTSISTHFNYLE
jgi:uncharacterized OsmC-like protein